MERFSEKTIEELKFYVYTLLDPRDNKIFYVGKGKGNRIFAHINGTLENPGESEKINIINEILNLGKEVKHLILRHGIENETLAYEIESAIIDLLTYPDYVHLSKLTNLTSGHHAWDRGIVTSSDAESLFSSKPLNGVDIQHNLLLININRSFRHGISPYEATRKHWKLNRNKLDEIEYVCGEYRGIIRGIYKPEKWLFNNSEKRWYFEGVEVTDTAILGLYLNRAYTGKKKGQANPIKYVMKHHTV